MEAARGGGLSLVGKSLGNPLQQRKDDANIMHISNHRGYVESDIPLLCNTYM